MKKPQLLLPEIYQKLYARFGPQDWWPGETRFEVMIGAILTQNTNWTNVEKAIGNLKKASLLNPLAFKEVSVYRLASLIKPSGYYNIKAKRLKNFINFLFKEYDGNLGKMSQVPLEVLRPKILAVNGIGEETADSILLYALDKPTFVIDSYTKRFLSRHRIVESKAQYSTIQKMFLRSLPLDVKMFNEYHALIVRLGKEYCRTRALCSQCPLNQLPHKAISKD